MERNKLENMSDTFRHSLGRYLKRTKEIERFLETNPDEWGQFQSEFNFEVNKVFQKIMDFERTCLEKGEKYKVEKLKNIFIKKFRHIFLRGVYNQQSLSKPYGYSGDFKIIEEIYLNEPKTTGFERLFDNYFQMSSISQAVRNRKEDFKKLIISTVNQSDKQYRIMDLACGPCREVKEILTSWQLKNKNIIFDCYDNDPRAIEYSRNYLKDHNNVNFIQLNALKLSSKNGGKLVKEKYDIIYATGLFDYFNFKISLGLVRNLKEHLKENGILAISDVRDKFSNPSVYYMEWVGEWKLEYSDDKMFRQVFKDAGFKENQLKFNFEQQGILQYVIATNSKK